MSTHIREASQEIEAIMGDMTAREPNGSGNGWRVGPAWLGRNASSLETERQASAISHLLPLYRALISARNEIAMRAVEDGGDARSINKVCHAYDSALDAFEAAR